MVNETVETTTFETAVKCFYGMHEWKYGTWMEDVGGVSAGQKVKACIHCSKVRLINHFEPPATKVFH